MTYVLGLTGSLGMGKSTTAAMFSDQGIPVWDADACVRALYAPGAPGAQAVATHYPTALHNGAVDRPALRALIAADPSVLDHLNALIHPLTTDARTAFLAARAAAPIVVLDIPLLFETGADATCHGIAVVSTAPDTQRARLRARGQMTDPEIDLILSRQMPDADKRRRATWVINTTTMDGARAQVADILRTIRSLRHA